MTSLSEISRASILIVDDNQRDVLLLDRILRGAGYGSITSTTVAEGVCALYQENRYDLILLDLLMPGMDGFEVMERLKAVEHGEYLPVIAITAQPDLELQALQAGARDFISKPFEPSEVLMRIHHMLEVRLLHQQALHHNLMQKKLVQKLQEANEKLVVATLTAQSLAEEIDRGKIRMAHLAQHDALTNLPNRILLNDRMKIAIGLAQRQGKRLAVMFVDLDRFKYINDSLGHAVGDQLLQSVASRLTAAVRSTDTVCRQGGDEFVILLADIEHAADAALSAQKILDALAVSHRIEHFELNVTASIGISIYPDNGENGETLIKNADIAMYQAKEAGRSHYRFFALDSLVLKPPAIARLTPTE